MTQSYMHDSQAVAARAELAARAEQRERFALVSIGVGTLASGASIVGALAASGGFVDAPVTPTIITALVSFFVCAVSSTLIVLTAIGFARVAERASTVTGRGAIITGGVAGGVGVVVVPLFLALYGFSPTAGVAALAIVATALALAGGALAPWRFGFARPTHAAATENLRVP
ncbi:MAG: hypothetical protein ACXIUP_06005 [Microcella sp.]